MLALADIEIKSSAIHNNKNLGDNIRKWEWGRGGGDAFLCCQQILGTHPDPIN